jgi:biotin operon repressor
MPTNDRIQEIADRALEIFKEWRGSRCSLSREDLCHKLDCGDRELRIAVRELRCQGHLIVADPAGGYRFARCGEEVYGYTSSLKSRIQALREVTEAMESQARRRFGEPVEQLNLM